MITRVNLLDWRAERRRAREKQFFVALGGGVLGAAALALGGMMYVQDRIANQQERNQILTTEIERLDRQGKEIETLEKTRENLLARMQVIEQLQASRSASVHFFDEITNTLPEGIALAGIKQNPADSTVTIDGVADSNGRVSTYIRNLDASPWFADPRLVVIKTSEKNKKRQAEFTLTVKNETQSNLTAAAAASTSGAVAAPGSTGVKVFDTLNARRKETEAGRTP